MDKLIKNNIFVLSLTLILLLSFTVCEKNPAEPEDEQAPPLPLIESMQMNVSFFTNSMNQSLNKATLSKNNFFAAGTRVLIINTVVLAASIVPTAVFAAAMSQTPELKRDGKFHWIYTVQQGGKNYSADLAGSIDAANSEVIWEMYVSSTFHNPALENFLWYEGKAKIGNTEGWWLFYHDQHPDSNMEVLKIDWQVSDSTHQDLAISNVLTGHKDYGDSLKYKIEDENCYLKFYDASTLQTSTINWNSQLGNGYIQWFDYLNGEISCWDENKDDVTCPPN